MFIQGANRRHLLSNTTANIKTSLSWEFCKNCRNLMESGAAFIPIKSSSCQSGFNDLHTRLSPTSVTRFRCIIRCQPQWVARRRAEQTRGQRKADKHETEDENMLKHGYRARRERIPKHTLGDRYADQQRGLSAITQTSRHIVRNAGCMPGGVCLALHHSVAY